MTTSASVLDMRRRVARTGLRVTSPERSGVAWWDITELGFAALGFLLYFLVRGGVVARTAQALAHARSIVHLEFSLGVFVEPNIQRWILSSQPLWRTANFVYFWCDFPLIVAVGLVLFWKHRSVYTLLRDALLVSGA